MFFYFFLFFFYGQVLEAKETGTQSGWIEEAPASLDRDNNRPASLRSMITALQQEAHVPFSRDSGNIGRDSGNIGRDSGNIGRDSGNNGNNFSRDKERATLQGRVAYEVKRRPAAVGGGDPPPRGRREEEEDNSLADYYADMNDKY